MWLWPRKLTDPASTLFVNYKCLLSFHPCPCDQHSCNWCVSSNFYSLINLTCQTCKISWILPPPVHLLLPHFFSLLFPLSLPPSIFGCLGVSLLRLTTMTMHRCRWVFLPVCCYPAIRQADRTWKACLLVFHYSQNEGFEIQCLHVCFMYWKKLTYTHSHVTKLVQ